jgi:hypothetical protein
MNFTDCVLLMKFWLHDLCAVKGKRRDEGEEYEGEGVRVMRWRECADGDRCVWLGMWQDRLMDGMAEHVAIQIAG